MTETYRRNMGLSAAMVPPKHRYVVCMYLAICSAKLLSSMQKCRGGKCHLFKFTSTT